MVDGNTVHHLLFKRLLRQYPSSIWFTGSRKTYPIKMYLFIIYAIRNNFSSNTPFKTSISCYKIRDLSRATLKCLPVLAAYARRFRLAHSTLHPAACHLAHPWLQQDAQANLNTAAISVFFFQSEHLAHRNNDECRWHQLYNHFGDMPKICVGSFFNTSFLWVTKLLNVNEFFVMHLIISDVLFIFCTKHYG